MIDTIPGHEKAEWVRSVGALVQQVEAWAHEEQWNVARSETQLTEEHFGSYQMPLLTIEHPSGRLILEPLPHSLSGTGRVKFYAWPSQYRVRLLHDARINDWTILTDSGIPIHQPWNKQTFVTLAQDLLRAS